MTLIEIMISLVILLFVSLAVLQTAMVGMNTNLQNSMRDEAVNVVDFRMNELRSMATGTWFDGGDLTVITNPTIVVEPAISRTLRGAGVTYTPTRTVSSINADTKQITMSVGWKYRGKDYTHSVTTIMRRS
jgi:type IV pilus assembly protein PilV